MKATRPSILPICCSFCLLGDEFGYAIAGFTEIDDAQLYRLTDPDIGRIGVDDRVDPQARLLGQFDESDDIRGHPARNEGLADHDVAEDGAVAADFLEVHGATGVPAALQRRMNPLPGVVAAAQHELAVLQTLPVRL